MKRLLDVRNVPVVQHFEMLFDLIGQACQPLDVTAALAVSKHQLGGFRAHKGGSSSKKKRDRVDSGRKNPRTNYLESGGWRTGSERTPPPAGLERPACRGRYWKDLRASPLGFVPVGVLAIGTGFAPTWRSGRSWPA